jgi:hypothetical protein
MRKWTAIWGFIRDENGGERFEVWRVQFQGREEVNADPTSLGGYEGHCEEFPNDESVEKIRNSKSEIRNRRERLQGFSFLGRGRMNIERPTSNVEH